jgi:hypothetical protein
MMKPSLIAVTALIAVGPALFGMKKASGRVRLNALGVEDTSPRTWRRRRGCFIIV